MNDRILQITQILNSIPDITIITSFQELINGDISGKVNVRESNIELVFNVAISPFYPFQFHDSETIRFTNIELIKFNHVMTDGLICIHTSHSPDLKAKLNFDFDSLKGWIKKYYVNGENDMHYEHIIVPFKPFKGTNFCYLYTDTGHTFTNSDFGYLNYSFLNQGFHNSMKINSFIIQSFTTGKEDVFCKWSSIYKMRDSGQGAYVFIEKAPVVNNRFAIEKWCELEPYVNQAFMSFLFGLQREVDKNDELAPLPLFIGYTVPSGETYWECAAIDVRRFPIYQKKIPKSRIYEMHLQDTEICWLQARNCSYDYFFGRGTLSKKIIEKRILIIGIGAIGSNVATTLVRGGCINVHLADYDIKEPENICRAEYLFSSGLNSKVEDLGRHLVDISPFVEVKPIERLTDFVKFAVNNGFQDETTTDVIEQYDYIFDCSTDNDLAYILDNLNAKTEIINLSITNYAKHLVCAIKPNLYTGMNEIFSRLNTNAEDLYNPTGCWSPTFKASYNDIASMVQYAVKHINRTINNDLSLRSFYLQEEDTNELNITMHQF